MTPEKAMHESEQARHKNPVSAFLSDCCDITGDNADFLARRELALAFNEWLVESERGTGPWRLRAVAWLIGDTLPGHMTPTGATAVPSDCRTGFTGIRFKRAYIEARAAKMMPPFKSCRDMTATEAARHDREHNAPRRITRDTVDAEIAAEEYHQTTGTTHVTCFLILHNGHTVTGESACIDPAGFDPDLARDLAKRKAREKVADLLAFLMREDLHREEQRRATARELLRGCAVAERDTLIRAVMAQVPE